MEYISHIINLVLLFIILGASYNLLIGYAGIFSMAHAAFFGIGAYTSALLCIHTGVNFFWGFALSFVVSFLAGTGLSLPTLRIRHEYVIVFSFAFQVVVFGLMMNWIDITGGEGGISGVPRPSFGPISFNRPTSYIPLYAIVCLGAFLVCWRVGRSPLGRLLRAIRANETAALSIGKNVVLNKVLIFSLSCGLAGIAGSLYGHYTIFVHPTDYSMHQTIFFLAIVVVGGAGNAYGPILGALILTLFPEILSFFGIGEMFGGPIRNILYGALLIAAMRYRPQGILKESVAVTGNTCSRIGSNGSNSNKEDSPVIVIRSSGPRSAQGLLKTDKAPYLKVNGVSKAFGGIQALFDLNLDLEKGKITSLIGPNGAGKTTIFNVISGFIKPDKGTIFFQNREITGLAPFQIARKGIARTFQDLSLFEKMSILENVMISIPGQVGERLGVCLLPFSRISSQERRFREKAFQILDYVGLADKADILVENLSYPEQKLLSLARLLATGADFFLMDEPTSGVDVKSIDKILNTAKEMAALGGTICIVEHNMDVVKDISDHMIFMAQGRAVKSGDPETIFSDSELARIYLGKKRGS